MRIYEKVHLVVATPGRILDLMEKKVIISSSHFHNSLFVDPNTTFCVLRIGFTSNGDIGEIRLKAKLESRTTNKSVPFCFVAGRVADPDTHGSAIFLEAGSVNFWKLDPSS
jgi:hypothetical protein